MRSARDITTKESPERRWSHQLPGASVPAPSARRARRSQRGSVLVEAAFVMPILMLITFGIIEFGQAYGNAATVASSSRSGARLGATGYTGAADKSAFVVTIGAAVKEDLSALSNGIPLEMWVYKASSGIPATCSAATNCWSMTWSTSTKTWSTPVGGWSNPDGCGAVLDTIGVQVKAQHNFVTKYFGSTKTITYKTSARLEPLPSDQCLAGA